MERPLASATWPSVPEGATVLVPVGATEQHGPHLPLSTDTDIAVAVAAAAAALVGSTPGTPVMVAPAISYGSSGEHQAFAGTSSIGTSALVDVVIELTRSMRTWARRVIFVNAHGGNASALDRAIKQLRDEGHDVAWTACTTEEFDLHAGRTETSLMLHLAPWHVHLDRAEAGNTAPLNQLLPTMIASGVQAVSPNGVLGDPARASAEEGRALLARMARRIADSAVGQSAVAR